MSATERPANSGTSEVDRPPTVVLAERVALLAFRATEGLYHEQPELWRMGERGRQHTLEDFTHHFAALALLNADTFRTHVRYCEDLFARRGFPQQWLEDAWRWMAIVVRQELPDPVAGRALAVLEARHHMSR